MTSHWTGPGSRPESRHKRAVGLRQLANGIYVPVLRAGAEQVRLAQVGGLYVMKVGATSGRRLAQVNGVRPLLAAAED